MPTYNASGFLREADDWYFSSKDLDHLIGVGSRAHLSYEQFSKLNFSQPVFANIYHEMIKRIKSNISMGTFVAPGLEIIGTCKVCKKDIPGYRRSVCEEINCYKIVCDYCGNTEFKNRDPE